MAYPDRNIPTGFGSTTYAAEIDQGLRSYMLKVYNYMAIGLVLTGLVAYASANAAINWNTMELTAYGQAIFMSPLKWVVMLAPLGAVMFLSFGINKLSVGAAQALFWGYSALVGLSLSSILLVYTGQSVTQVFFISAASFGALSLYGYTTKRNLSAMGSFLIMGLFGLIIASLVNIFMQSSAMAFAISVVGVGVFAGLTAYDTQNIKEMYYEADSVETMGRKAIMGALSLYLDFINMFMMLLRLMGDRR
ncbi:Bax inhibitor-1/YccA family protein [Oryzibacter oryziterrae]|uniref:Bax inhibitor-1/YccA family protein n=1 Tax=Oryzibacter oryziterrae TaxID=2766474 RepID=UPI001F372F8E|nr:Bax inhibitor-1/YccA family protein [Oryzibacter oryziterrae]